MLHFNYVFQFLTMCNISVHHFTSLVVVAFMQSLRHTSTLLTTQLVCVCVYVCVCVKPHGHRSLNEVCADTAMGAVYRKCVCVRSGEGVSSFITDLQQIQGQRIYNTHKRTLLCLLIHY